MTARGYEFYLRVFNSISHEWAQAVQFLNSPLSPRPHIGAEPKESSGTGLVIRLFGLHCTKLKGLRTWTKAYCHNVLTAKVPTVDLLRLNPKRFQNRPPNSLQDTTTPIPPAYNRNMRPCIPVSDLWVRCARNAAKQNTSLDPALTPLWHRHWRLRATVPQLELKPDEKRQLNKLRAILSCTVFFGVSS